MASVSGLPISMWAATGTYPNRTRALTRCIALALTQEVFHQAQKGVFQGGLPAWNSVLRTNTTQYNTSFQGVTWLDISTLLTGLQTGHPTGSARVVSDILMFDLCLG